MEAGGSGGEEIPHGRFKRFLLHSNSADVLPATNSTGQRAFLKFWKWSGVIGIKRFKILRNTSVLLKLYLLKPDFHWEKLWLNNECLAYYTWKISRFWKPDVKNSITGLDFSLKKRINLKKKSDTCCPNLSIQ